MKFSLRWLRDYATLDAPVEAIVKALVDTGTEVGTVEIGGEGIVVARITAVSPVPGSSHLQFADLDLGGEVPPSLAAFSVEPGTVRVMTGAPNVKAGDLVPYAPPGTRPPAMDERLGVRTIRGHKSPGMLCSAIELGVGEDADGILILDDGTPGQALADVLAMDTVLDLDITTNRPDCLCHVGIARELAAALGEGLNEPPCHRPRRVALGNVRGVARPGQGRGPRRVPTVLGSGDRGCRRRALAGMAAPAPPRRGAAADQQRGGRDQLRAPRAR